MLVPWFSLEDRLLDGAAHVGQLLLGLLSDAGVVHYCRVELCLGQTLSVGHVLSERSCSWILVQVQILSPGQNGCDNKGVGRFFDKRQIPINEVGKVVVQIGDSH